MRERSPFGASRAAKDEVSEHRRSQMPPLTLSPPPPIAPRDALFLDIDGTLLDLAPTPAEVRVDAEVSGLLPGLHAALRRRVRAGHGPGAQRCRSDSFPVSRFRPRGSTAASAVTPRARCTCTRRIAATLSRLRALFADVRDPARWPACSRTRAPRWRCTTGWRRNSRRRCSATNGARAGRRAGCRAVPAARKDAGGDPPRAARQGHRDPRFHAANSRSPGGDRCSSATITATSMVSPSSSVCAVTASRSGSAAPAHAIACPMSLPFGSGSPRCVAGQLAAGKGRAMKASLELALVGNGQVGFLIDAEARIVWGCMPRFDSDADLLRACSTPRRPATSAALGHRSRRPDRQRAGLRAQHRRAGDATLRPPRRRHRDHRLRAALRSARPGVSPDDAVAPGAAAVRQPARRDPAAADLELRLDAGGDHGRQQPRPLCRTRTSPCA